MSTTPVTSETSSGLPPRTWQCWWHELPGYWRIAAWTGLFLFALSAAAVIRLLNGLMEFERINSIHHRGARIWFSWNDIEVPGPDLIGSFKLRLLKESLYGPSPCSQVAGLDLTLVQSLTAADVEKTLRFFSNVQLLSVCGHPLKSEDLIFLRECRNLRTLILWDTEVDDQIADHLKTLPQLENLGLQGTLVSDEIIPRLNDMRSLKHVSVMGTNLSSAAIQNTPIFNGFAPHPGYLQVATRWSDGRKSWLLKRTFTTKIEGPLYSDAAKAFQQSFPALDVPAIQTSHLGDGDYRLTLNIGVHTSEPVVITIVSGNTTSRTIEFHMPVTKAEVLPVAE